ncbi:hypothetical protein, partial [Vibrio echinoideorum]|uniref:hypothetical protein n=1 Tax=Vibrio echinoideorum TaxID=2100116 RepID=UPI0035515733
RVDIGADVQDFYRFEKVTEDGVKTVEVNDQRKHGGGVHVSVNGGDWKHFDGSRIAAAKDFIAEHLKPADMPQLSDPEYGNGIVGEGWTRVDIGAGVEGYYKFENITEDGVGQAAVQVNKNVHGDITSVTISGNTVDGTEFDKDFDGSKISNIKDFIDEHLKPADVTLPPTVKNNVKDKVQSIDPAKLQKAKSAIQQRLRG